MLYKYVSVHGGGREEEGGGIGRRREAGVGRRRGAGVGRSITTFSVVYQLTSAGLWRVK